MFQVFAVYHREHDGCANHSHLVDVYAIEQDALDVAQGLEAGRDEYQDMDDWFVAPLDVK